MRMDPDERSVSEDQAAETFQGENEVDATPSRRPMHKWSSPAVQLPHTAPQSSKQGLHRLKLAQTKSPRASDAHFGPRRTFRAMSMISASCQIADVATIDLLNSKLTRSVPGPLSLYWAFAVDHRATRPIEHVAAGGAELLFILNKALGYATRIRDSVPAKPHRIRRTRICIRLCISDRR